MAFLPQKTQAPASRNWVVGDRDLDQRLVQKNQTRHKMVLVLLLAFIVGAGSIQAVPHADPVITQAAVAQDLSRFTPTRPAVLNQNAAVDPSANRPLSPRDDLSHTTTAAHAREQATSCLPAAETFDTPTMATLAAVPHAR